MERFHLTKQVALEQPYEEIERAFVIWDLDNKHDRFKSDTNN